MVREPETAALIEFVRSASALTSSALARAEVMRAIRRVRRSAARAESTLDVIALVPIDDGIIRAAAELDPATLGTLGAIHLATALSLGSDISRLVTYDDRLTRAATAAGLEVIAPSDL